MIDPPSINAANTMENINQPPTLLGSSEGESAVCATADVVDDDESDPVGIASVVIVSLVVVVVAVAVVVVVFSNVVVVVVFCVAGAG